MKGFGPVIEEYGLDTVFGRVTKGTAFKRMFRLKVESLVLL